MRWVPLAIAIALACACASSPTAQATPTPSSTPTATAEPTPSPPPGDEGTPVARQVLPPASDLPNGALCTAPIHATADGNADPLLCTGGAVNVQAWKFYASISASILGLGLNPTEGQAQSAICDDFNHNHATKPEETSGFQLAKAYYGWSFTIDPATVSCT